MKSKKGLYALLGGGAVLLTAVVAYALTNVTINVVTAGSSITTRSPLSPFPVGSATVVGTCTDPGAGSFQFDFGDGSASTFNPIGIPGTMLTAQFVACNPLGTGSLNQLDLTASATLSLKVQLTGTFISDVGPNCFTGCITMNLTGVYDSTLTGTLNDPNVTVTAAQGFANCNGQDAALNSGFGLPSMNDISVTLATNVDPASCM